MKFTTIVRRHNFYIRWHNALPALERNSWLGQWILERITIYTGIIKEVERSVARFSDGGRGNYNTDHLNLQP